MSDYILLTGATGLVGGYLMRDLLKRGHRLAVLVRSTRKQTAHERVEAILQRWERDSETRLPRPICLEGNVNEPLLGLDAADRRWVGRYCGTMLHNAAVLTFYGADRNGDPWRTNVGGTRNVLETCQTLQVPDLHYVSTAYVCGQRDGVIREDELDCGQSFRNDYEQSKFLAEMMVRQADLPKRPTVYRPAVISGDSKTGYTNTYHGLYMYLKLVSVLVGNTSPDADGRRYTPVRLNLTGDEKRNIIPVDWVSAVICRLLETSEAHGGTYHLAPREPVTPRQIIEVGYERFNSYGVEFCPDAAEVGTGGEMDQVFQSQKTIYESYEKTDPLFDMSNLLRFAADLPCPEIDRAMLHRYWDYGELDRWGKRRQPARSIDRSLYEQFERVSWDGEAPADSDADSRSAWEMVGLDFVGPGGGGWKVGLNEGTPVMIEKGLPSKGRTVQLSVDQWQSLFEMPFDDAVEQLGRQLGANEIADPEALASWLLRSLMVGHGIPEPKLCEGSPKSRPYVAV